MKVLICTTQILTIWLLISLNGVAFSQRTASGLLMESMFSPQLAPPHKTMGLAQRSFLDAIEEVDSQLELALVVDATDSMGDCIADMKQAVTKMIDDLNRYRGGQISFQLVTYRDAGAGQRQTVAYPLNVKNNAFVSDVDQFQEAIAAVQTGSGAPYFHELVDVGLHHAITELDWSKDETTAKWIILFGDAPPYESGFRDDSTGAARKIETDQLISLANQNSINMHCVLCTSRDSESEAYQSVLPATREFMGAISTQTGGLLVDLSYNDIRRAVQSTMAKPRVKYQPLKKISREDVSALRRKLASDAASGRRARIAILPHLPLSNMSFDSNRTEVMIAAELRHKFRMIDNTDVKSAHSVKRMFTALDGRGLRVDEFLRTFANGLKVDYVVWGTVKELAGAANTVEIRSAFYSRDTGKQIVSSFEPSTNLNVQPAQNVTNQLASKLVRDAAAAGNVDKRLAMAFQVNEKVAVRVVRPVATTPQTRDQILVGFDLLEKSLEYKIGETAGLKLLAQAEITLRKATESDPQNAMAQQLLANCYFNQSRYFEEEGDVKSAKQRARGYTSALQLAKRNQSSVIETTRTEIQADYELFLGAPQKAIELYKQLTSRDDSADRNLHTARRAHWMLAGVFSGDFGVDAKVINPALAREHLLQILAEWPQSSEAEFIRREMRWDETSGETKHNHFPRKRSGVSQLIES